MAEERKFLVRVAGTNCRVRITDAEGRPRTTTGFFATRFVLAHDAADAGSKALDVVLSDLSQLQLDDPERRPDLSVDAVREDARAYDDFAPGRGFTWF